MYVTGILVEEPNPTGSRPRDLIERETLVCIRKTARERWVLLKIPRCDIDRVGEVK